MQQSVLFISAESIEGVVIAKVDSCRTISNFQKNLKKYNQRDKKYLGNISKPQKKQDYR